MDCLARERVWRQNGCRAIDDEAVGLAIGHAVEELQITRIDQFSNLSRVGQHPGFALIGPFYSEMIPEGTPSWLASLVVKDGWLEAHDAGAGNTIGKDPDLVGAGDIFQLLSRR